MNEDFMERGMLMKLKDKRKQRGRVEMLINKMRKKAL